MLYAVIIIANIFGVLTVCGSGTVGLAGTMVISIIQPRKPRHKKVKSEPRSDSFG